MKKQFRNQPTVFIRAIDNNMMYFKMGVAIWRDERLNPIQKAILGQILSHNENGDNPYIINKNAILKQLGVNSNNTNNHWNGLKELGYLKNLGSNARAQWVIDETKAKDSEWYKKHHPDLNLTKESFERINDNLDSMGVENNGIVNIGIQNNDIENNGLQNKGVQTDALSNNKNKNEQLKGITTIENFYFSKNEKNQNEDNLLTISGDGPLETKITKDVYGNPLSEEEIVKINKLDE